jgi:hypothetical protein
VTLSIDPQTSAQRLKIVEAIADMQAIIVFIDVDVLVERAIALITIRNSLYSSLNPILTTDIRELVDEMLINVISQYRKARMFCLVHDCRVEPNTVVERPELDTHWAKLANTHPFHETYFGYQMGCQTGGALACWRDQMMFLYNVSKIFGDIFSRLSNRFLSFGRNFKIVCCFPLVGFCVENEASLVQAPAVPPVQAPVVPYHSLHMNVVIVQNGQCQMKITEHQPELVATSIMGQISYVIKLTAGFGRMIVYETLWNTDALLKYCFTPRGDTVFSQTLLIKQRNYDGSVACLVDIGPLREELALVTRTVATWHVISQRVRYSGIRERNARPSWLRSIRAHGEGCLSWLTRFGSDRVTIGREIENYIRELQAKHMDANFPKININFYLNQFPFYRYHRNPIGGNYTKKIAGDILLLGPKLWLVSNGETMASDCEELVRGTLYSPADVSNWLLTEYAIAHKLILLDKTVVDWTSGFPGQRLYMHGSRWLICGRSQDLDPREVMFNSCQTDTALGIDTFRQSNRGAQDDLFFATGASIVNNRQQITIGNNFDQSLLQLYDYTVPAGGRRDFAVFFNGTLSASQQVCAYGCKRLKADAGNDLWDEIVKPNLVLFREAMNAAYMATMRLVVLLDVACRANGSSLVEKSGASRRGQLARNKPDRIVAQQTTSERAGRRYHTWIFAALESGSFVTWTRFVVDRTLDSLKTVIAECRELSEILTTKFPIIDGVTVRLDADYRVSIFFDGWSTDAIAIYVAALAISQSSEQVDQIDVSDIKINIANKLRRVVFFNITQRVY